MISYYNIVSVFGFCDEGREMMLVFEDASNGSSDDHMRKANRMASLLWAWRLQKCFDIREGWSYLRENMNDKLKVIHRDIKNANIVLDDIWNAEDCRLWALQVTTCECKMKKEADVYSFGVVLFEIMCGRLAYNELYNANNEKGLPSMVIRRFIEETLKEMVDPKIKGADENILVLTRVEQDSLDAFSKIAYQCLAETQAKRPTREVAIKELEKALNMTNLSYPVVEALICTLRLEIEDGINKQNGREKGKEGVEG
ncbi:protein kinase-like domain-containing protein [Artemisia annua]|uniref:Protein kinase-like domain-containing protein n=1 Tax=Artemisia annua TaxID=35608 RepID=A0A2U1KSF5_ARTAN|nr:protein kinase-like domain-containing protein [Artemisia annua]